MQKKASEQFSINKNKKTLALIILGSLVWSLTMIKSGLIYPFGVGFWGPHGHDGIWHIALSNSLSKGSLTMPVYGQEALKNYHIGFDLLIALLYKITHIPIINLYFQIIPPLIALSIGLLTYLLVKNWTKSNTKANWSVFFIYLSGSLGWVINLIRGQELGGESMFWSQQAISTLVNPPFALSILIMLVGLNLLSYYEKTKKRRFLLFAIYSFALLAQVKIYASFLSIASLVVISIYLFFFKKRKDYLIATLKLIVMSFILFIPLNKSSTSLLVIKPFWFLETLLSLSDRFYFPKLYELLINSQLSNNLFKQAFVYTAAFCIFIVGNMAGRLIGIFYFFGKRKDSEILPLFFLLTIIIGTVMPMVFLQSGTPWNTIQFFYYSLFFMSILAGISFTEVIKKSKLLALMILILTVPTSFLTLKHYLPGRPPAKVSSVELKALNFLKEKEEGIVLTYPFDKFKSKEAEPFPPRPLSLYESTAYVSAFSNKNVFLEDEINLDITNYNWKERRAIVDEFYKSTDHNKVFSFLRENNIKYVYWLKGQRATLGESQLGIEKIFENEEVDIYIVK